MLSPNDRAALRKRLQRLGSGLERLDNENKNKVEKPTSKINRRSSSAGLRIITDFVAAVVVGLVIGLAIDRWFETTPFAMLIFVLLGVVTGFLNLIRASNKKSNPDSHSNDTSPPGDSRD